jgi:hypothetical protein
MDNSFFSMILSGRELLFLGGGAAALGTGAVLLPARGNLVGRRAQAAIATVASALLIAGLVLARAGF